MIEVNRFALSAFIEALAGLADDDEYVERFRSLDVNSETQVKEVIRELIVPRFLDLSEYARDKARVAGRYYIATRWPGFERFYESMLPPFDAPRDARELFIWIWEEVFPGEAIEPVDTAEFAEKPDMNWRRPISGEASEP
jgi:hypothetical protein